MELKKYRQEKRNSIKGNTILNTGPRSLRDAVRVNRYHSVVSQANLKRVSEVPQKAEEDDYERKLTLTKNKLVLSHTDQPEDQSLDDILKEIAQTVRTHRLKDIKDFSLKLRNCSHLTPERLRNIFLYISRNLQNLEKLQLKLHLLKDSGTWERFDSLEPVLSKLKNLKSFRLQLINAFFDNADAFENLLEDLKINLSKLEHLQLQIIEGADIDDLILESLANFIKESKCLKNLELNLTVDYHRRIERDFSILTPIKYEDRSG